MLMWQVEGPEGAVAWQQLGLAQAELDNDRQARLGGGQVLGEGLSVGSKW